MELKMPLEDFEAEKAKWKKEGYNEAIDEISSGLKEAYDDMTSGFLSRIGREANIEFTRRIYNSIITYRKK